MEQEREAQSVTKLDILKNIFGHSEFREGQEELIDSLLAGRDVLGIMPTGAGKSICYQLPCLMLPDITLVVSPLISLMKDQVMALKSCGVAAAYINSSLTPAQQTEALRRASLGTYKIIYIAPERLETTAFLNFALQTKISLVAVDEAHCVSQWGQDFRPSYLRIRDFLHRFPNRPPVAAFTATATNKVREDVIRLLGLEHPHVAVTGYDRENLMFSIVKPSNKYVYLVSFLREHEEDCGIIYCNTRKVVEEICAKLKMDGFSVSRYHAGLSDEERVRNQDDFRYDRIRVMVATNAFGMGIDKPDVRYVVHYNMPKCMENYYQEAGRAGRDGMEAECVLLYSGQDVITGKWLIDHSEPNPELTSEEAEHIRRLDHERLTQMTYYATSTRCLRQRILQYFGETALPGGCRHCSVCLHKDYVVNTGNTAPVSLRDQRSIQKAEKPEKKSLTVREEAIYENLKILRKLIADCEKVPAFMILYNSTLVDMIRLMPQNERDFMRVNGIGEVKCRKFGKVFLKVLCEGKEPNEAFLDYEP